MRRGHPVRLWLSGHGRCYGRKDLQTLPHRFCAHLVEQLGQILAKLAVVLRTNQQHSRVGAERRTGNRLPVTTRVPSSAAASQSRSPRALRFLRRFVLRPVRRVVRGGAADRRYESGMHVQPERARRVSVLDAEALATGREVEVAADAERHVLPLHALQRARAARMLSGLTADSCRRTPERSFLAPRRRRTNQDAQPAALVTRRRVNRLSPSGAPPNSFSAQLSRSRPSAGSGGTLTGAARRATAAIPGPARTCAFTPTGGAPGRARRPRPALSPASCQLAARKLAPSWRDRSTKASTRSGRYPYRFSKSRVTVRRQRPGAARFLQGVREAAHAKDAMQMLRSCLPVPPGVPRRKVLRRGGGGPRRFVLRGRKTWTNDVPPRRDRGPGEDFLPRCLDSPARRTTLTIEIADRLCCTSE